jgi:16S rRNA (cytidine1402-2'-O)-methyltransferase
MALYLLPAWLSEEAPPSEVVPAAVLERIRALDTFIVENAKSARAWLSACGHPGPIRTLTLLELNEHTHTAAIPGLLDSVGSKDVGLLSEAGLPAIADPGAALVAQAHARGIAVVPLVGPSSLLLALMASGLEGQRFRFLGYLPAEAGARRTRLAEIERHSTQHAETQIFIETPYRNDALLTALLETCRATTRLAVAASLTAPDERIRVDTIEGWRKRPEAIGKRPAVFLLLA